MGIEYTEIFGPSVPGDQIAALQPFTVDADDVAKTLDALIAARSGSPPKLIISPSVTSHEQDDSKHSIAPITRRWDLPRPALVGAQQGERTAAAGTIMAHLAGIGDVSARIGEWIGRSGSINWIEGFQVNPDTDAPGRPLAYRGILGPHEATPWATMSEFIGTRGQSLALRGLCVDITASAGERYYCTYSAIFADGSHFDDVECGTPCHSPKWSALCALKINLYEIREQRLGPRTQDGSQPSTPPASIVSATDETDNSARPGRDEANASNVGTAVSLGQATALVPVTLSVPALRDVLEGFLSLGDNCEFGLVQRQVGAEPVDLLRFAAFFFPGQKRLLKLTEGLAARFSGLGELETITCNYYEDRPPGEYIIRESAWGLFYHTGRNKNDIDAEKLRRQQVASLQMRVRKMLRELELGKRICVWKSNVGSDQEAIDRLVGGIQAYGPTLLLWVQTEDARHPSGTVEYAGAGLLKGYVGRFAPYDRAFEIDHPPWHAVCRAAASMRNYLRLSGVWPTPGSESSQDGGFVVSTDGKPITLMEAATDLLWDEQAAKATTGELPIAPALAAKPSARRVRVAVLSNIVFDATSAILFCQGREIRETRYLASNHATEDVKVNPIGLRSVAPDKLAIIGFNRGVTNPYHWIMQCLPALYRSVQMVGRDHCVLVLPDLAPWQEGTLAKLGLDALPRVMVKLGRQYYFPRVIFSENLTGRGGAGVSPDLRAMFELLATDMEPQNDEPTLIYCPPVRTGPLPDGQALELEAALWSRGFVTVGSASTRIDDQFRLFRNARVVIGHQGLGLVGLAFCRPGTKILEIQPTSTANSRFAELAQSVGLDYHSLLYGRDATSRIGSQISGDDKPTLIENVSSWLHQCNH